VVGGGLGAVYAMLMRHVVPNLVSDPGFYSLVAMAAVFGGIARAPFTSIVFLFELSHNPNALLPLLVCVMIADGFTRLFSRDSIMTVKLVKRGLTVLQDYSAPVLMRARIDQVMRTEFPLLRAEDELRAALAQFPPDEAGFVPVVNAAGGLEGIVDARDLLRAAQPGHRRILRENVVVVQSSRSRKPVGIARANDILALRRWLLEEETAELRRASLDEPAASPGVKLA